MYIYEDIIWFIENTALIFFMRLACTYFLSKKRMTDSCHSSFVLNFWRGRTKEFAVLVNRIFSNVTGDLITATISVNVGKALIHSSDFTE